MKLRLEYEYEREGKGPEYKNRIPEILKIIERILNKTWINDFQKNTEIRWLETMKKDTKNRQDKLAWECVNANKAGLQVLSASYKGMRAIRVYMYRKEDNLHLNKETIVWNNSELIISLELVKGVKEFSFKEIKEIIDNNWKDIYKKSREMNIVTNKIRI